ncbi:MAG: gamma-glutamyltransferase family protein [Phycisphaerales bacterium]|nr:gamma-glutamyltransferase family protein [Phycisphaerales bacterium]
MVATSQPLAAQAGLEMLRRGGSAADAAIATAAALTVLEPTTNGLGGDAFALVWDGVRVQGLNGSGRSPAALSRERVRATSYPTRGWLPVTVPGQIDAWAQLHGKFGRLKFAELLESAIGYARDGYQVAPLTAALWAKAAPALSRGHDHAEHWAATFLPTGTAPAPGERVFLPDHARTLERIAASHGRDFYEGEIAARILAHSSATGGLLDTGDLARHSSEWVEPIHIDYRGYRLHEIPPNGQGIAALVALGILERRDLATLSPDCPDAIHLGIEAIKLGFADAHSHVADRAHMTRSPDEMLDPARLAALATRIDLSRAQDFSSGIPKPGGTVYLCAADSRGMMVSFIQSNYAGWGSGIVVPGTGIALQNRGACFSLAPGHPNEVGPSKRPYHTIIPGMVTRIGATGGDEPAMAFGVMGGFMQPQGHVQVVTRMVDAHQNPQAALDAPRWQWMRDLSVQLEPGVADATIADLRARGHAISIADSRSVSFGRGQAIVKMPDGWMGASDLRGDGMVAAR